jgi:hypothetical protein
MSNLRTAAQQALEALETVFMPHHPAVIALREALAEEALQRLTDVHQEIEAVLEQPTRAQRQRDAGYTRRPTIREMPALEKPKFTLSCGCPSQYGGVPAYWERDGGTAFGMICEKHWHEYGARSEA